MIEKIKKTIAGSVEDEVLNIDQKDIEQYLSEVKKAVEKDNYRIDRNARRQDNINLFLDYVIDEAKAKEIILSLTAMDFSEILQNEHKGFEHEKLYVFGKDVILLERNGSEEKTVSLYIKFNKLENCFVIIISFHEQKYPLMYYFR
ncbi:Motility quorum-sensing regulator, toxin of MqsA [Butyrivibrio sp. Su6]|nr:Motility quorum-sensing regulator, toxin of MqsA [Butyrivibrio sp. Su6]